MPGSVFFDETFAFHDTGESGEKLLLCWGRLEAFLSLQKPHQGNTIRGTISIRMPAVR